MGGGSLTEALAVEGEPRVKQTAAPDGVSMKLFDYWLTEQDAPDNVSTDDYYTGGINGEAYPEGLDEDDGHILKFLRHVDWTGRGHFYTVASEGTTVLGDRYPINSGDGIQDNDVRKQIVESTLAKDGYPVAQAKRGSVAGGVGDTIYTESLAYLFDADTLHQGKRSYEVTTPNLFSIENGYYVYDSASNHAYYDEESQGFIVLDGPGATWENVGQFFPFNGVEGEKSIYNADGSVRKADDEDQAAALNHYFGVQMDFNFTQPADGKLGGQDGTPMVFEFSGDDDVWVFIDGVLVLDMGGIRGAASGKIDFSTGEVTFGNGNERTLSQLFKDAGVSAAFNGDVFRDGTNHTLKFFYLERGNSASNMYMKFNLKNAPQSTVRLVDQDGAALSEGAFRLYAAQDETYDLSTAQAVTEELFVGGDGRAVLSDATKALKFDKQGYYILKQTAVADGYRKTADQINLRYEPEMNTFVVDGYCENGAMGGFDVQVTQMGEVHLLDGGEPVRPSDGQLKAVVMHKKDGQWHALGSGKEDVQASSLTGWFDAEVAGLEGISGSTRVWTLGKDEQGLWSVLFDDLPGSTLDYLYGNSGNPDKALYDIWYYYDNGSTRQRIDASDFRRDFASHITVPNVNNVLRVQMIDEKGAYLKGAKFGLYEASAVEDGALSDGKKPIQSVTTDGSGVVRFERLAEGEYWVVQTAAPSGYLADTTPVKVLVTSEGVYADAVEGNEVISVKTGVGTILRPVFTRALHDALPAPLNEVTATLETSVDGKAWAAQGDTLRLDYDASDKLLDYGLAEGEDADEPVFAVEGGFARARVNALADLSSDEIKDGADVTGAFTGSNVLVYKNKQTELVIRKTVTAAEGHEAPASTFTFEVTTDSEEVKGKAYAYRLSDDTEAAAGASAHKLSFDANGKATLELSVEATEKGVSKEVACTILGLPAGAELTVAESDLPSGFTQMEPENDELAKATVAADDEPATVAFVNSYQASPVEFKLLGTKKIEGETPEGYTLDEGAYSFVVRGMGEGGKDNPLPSLGVEGKVTVGGTVYPTKTVKNGAAADDGLTASFDFGSIWFVAPGDYSYVVWESDTSNQQNVLNDSRRFFVHVEVVDENGSLKASPRYGVVDDLEGEPQSADAVEFVNTYIEGRGGFFRVSTSLTNENTGESMDVEQKFSFRFKTLGGFETNGGSHNKLTIDAAEVPEFEKVNAVDGFTMTSGEAGMQVTPNTLFTTADQGKTYVYEIVELLNGEPVESETVVDGVTYSGKTVRIEAEVGVASDGKLPVTIRYYNSYAGESDWGAATQGNQGGVSALFPHTYKAASTTLGVSAAKTLNGRDMKADEFAFSFGNDSTKDDAEADGMVMHGVGGVEYEGSNSYEVKNPAAADDAKSAEFALGSVEFTKAGSYTFYVWEKGADGQGLTLDHGVREVKVGVADNGVGDLHITGVSVSKTPLAEGASKAVADFVNTYQASGSIAGDDPAAGGPFGTVKLTGRDMQAEEFSFTAAPANESGESIELSSGVALASASVANTAAKAGVPSDLNLLSGTEFTQKGDYYFVVSQVVPGDAQGGVKDGVTYDRRQFLVKYAVTDNGDGTLAIAATVAKVRQDASGEWKAPDDDAMGQVAFVNVYKADRPTPIEPDPGNPDAPGTVTGWNLLTDATKTVANEMSSSAVSPAGFPFSVVATGDDAKEAATLLTDAEGAQVVSGSDGAIDLSQAFQDDAAMTAGQMFTYTVAEADFNADEHSGVTKDSSVYKVTLTATDNGKGAADIEVKAAKQSAGDPVSAIAFENVYRYDPTEHPAKQSLEAQVATEGRATVAEEYRFELRALGVFGDDGRLIAGEEAPMPDGSASGAKTAANAEAAADGQPAAVSFGEVAFAKAGNYAYRVAQTTEPKGGLALDERVLGVVFVVGDGGHGRLEVLETLFIRQTDAEKDEWQPLKDAATVAFVNRYQVSEGAEAVLDADGGLTGQVLIENRDWLPEDEFTVRIEAGDDATRKALEEGRVSIESAASVVKGTDESSQWDFGSITFKDEGEYRFVITQDEGDDPGLAYDPHELVADVRVFDNGQGGLAAALTTTGSCDFVNTYRKPGPLPVSFPSVKVELDGRDLSAGEFSVKVEGENGAPTPAPETLSIDATGAVDFGSLAFAEGGVYRYAVSQVIPVEGEKLPGVTYDDESHEVVIKVRDNQHGKLELSAIEVDGASSAEGIVFRNTYQANPLPSDEVQKIAAALSGAVSVESTEGNAYELAAGAFSFKAQAAAGAPAPQQATVGNAEDGSFSFSFAEGAFSAPGEYAYTVTQEARSLPGVTIDVAEYTVVATVVDDNAQLVLDGIKTIVVREGVSSDAEEILFLNKYNPNKVAVELVGSITLNGRDLLADEFAAVIEATGEGAQNAPMPQVARVQNKPAADGAADPFSFGKIEYVSPGTWTYLVRQVPVAEPVDDTIKLDDAAYALTVEVVDDGGALKASVLGADPAKLDFVNAYKPHSAIIVPGDDPQAADFLGGVVELCGRTMDADEFEFELRARNGDKVVAKATGGIAGETQAVFCFPQMEFDAPGTHRYLLMQVNRKRGGVTYDDPIYEVVIEVTEGDGHQLEAAVSYYLADAPSTRAPEDAAKPATFRNTYKAAATEVSLAATVTFKEGALEKKMFSFKLTDATGAEPGEGEELQTVSNDESGAVRFEAISYSEPGEYRYCIEQVPGDNEKIEYDDSKFDVTVKVTDDREGHLVAEVVYSKKPAFENAYGGSESGSEDPPDSDDSDDPKPDPDPDPSDPDNPNDPDDPNDPNDPDDSDSGDDGRDPSDDGGSGGGNGGSGSNSGDGSGSDGGADGVKPLVKTGDSLTGVFSMLGGAAAAALLAALVAALRIRRIRHSRSIR